MSAKVTAGSGLQRLTDAIQKDIYDLITRYVSQFDCTLTAFKEIWKELRFSCIHHACPERLQYSVYLQILFSTVIKSFDTCPINLGEHSQIIWNIGVSFTLYCLHQTQLHGLDSLLPIKVSLNDMYTIERISSTSDSSTRNIFIGCSEAKVVISILTAGNCFVLSTITGHYLTKNIKSATVSTSGSEFIESTTALMSSSTAADVVLAVSDNSSKPSQPVGKLLNTEADEYNDINDVKVKEDSNVVTQLTELLPARRAKQQLLASAEREKQTIRSEKESKRLHQRLSKLSKSSQWKEEPISIKIENISKQNTVSSCDRQNAVMNSNSKAVASSSSSSGSASRDQGAVMIDKIFQQSSTNNINNSVSDYKNESLVADLESISPSNSKNATKKVKQNSSDISDILNSLQETTTSSNSNSNRVSGAGGLSASVLEELEKDTREALKSKQKKKSTVISRKKTKVVSKVNENSSSENKIAESSFSSILDDLEQQVHNS